jgi:2-oxoglutarate dehydrogenase E1 component
MMLIRTYRVRGHLAANLDPLGLSHLRPARRPDARISRHFAGADLDRKVYIGGTLGLEWATIRELVGDPAPQLLRQCRP